MSTKLKIFLDMDGVIVDFVMPAMAMHNAEITGETAFPKGFGWDILGATNKIRKDRGFNKLSASQFWNALGYSFWANLRPYPLAFRLISRLETVGDVYFATSPTLSGACFAGKYDWVRHNLPHLKRKLIITADKTVLATANSILIDDRDRNVDDFIECGGQAILVPRPWNNYGPYPCNKHPYDVVLEKLRKLL